MFRVFVLLVNLFFISGLSALEEELWVFQQDFYSFGKRDVYESLKRIWVQQITELSKEQEIPFMLTIQSKDNPEFITLVHIGNWCALDNFSGITKALEKKVGVDVWRKQQEARDSILNFQIGSLQHFLPESSCIPKEGCPSLMQHPYVHYFIYSLRPGQDSFFEESLQKKAKEHLEKKDGVSWRVWKVLFGADVPKYVIMVCANTEESLSDKVSKLNIIDSHLSQVIRQRRDGKGILRRDLSYLPTQVLPDNGEF